MSTWIDWSAIPKGTRAKSVGLVERLGVGVAPGANPNAPYSLSGKPAGGHV